jgi:hypothetical protein
MFFATMPVVRGWAKQADELQQKLRQSAFFDAPQGGLVGAGVNRFCEFGKIEGSAAD